MSETGAHHGKRVTWAELFFDLVFVFAVVQVAGLLAVHHQWWGVGRAMVVLVPVFVSWVAATMQTNRRGQDHARERVGLFAIGLCGMVMAVAIPHAYDDGGLLFAVAYVLARVVLVLRYPPRTKDDMWKPFSTALVLSGPLIVLGSFLGDPWRETVWALAVVVDLSMPLVIRSRVANLVYDGGHLAERFGLFVIIALGESIVDIGLPLARQPDLASGLELVGLGTAFVLVCALWWTYFDAFNHTIAHFMAREGATGTITYHVLYGHFGVIASIVTIAVGFENMITQPGQPMALGHLSLLYVGCIGFLLSIAYIWWMANHRLRGTRIGAAVVLLALLPLATQLSGLVATALAAVVLLVLCRVERQWPLPIEESPFDERAQA